jgi:hypothetical protein
MATSWESIGYIIIKVTIMRLQWQTCSDNPGTA